jgi:hypothetical protein
MDLQSFCSTSPFRPEISGPFSQGDYTYATDGVVIVRVPSIAEIEAREVPNNVGKLFANADMSQDFRLLRYVALPTPPTEECDECHGRGTLHDCPSCNCVCEECSGRGKTEKDMSMYIGTQLIAVRAARKLMTLPNVRVPSEMDAKQPIPFKFDGGDGLFMALSRQYPDHSKERI